MPTPEQKDTIRVGVIAVADGMTPPESGKPAARRLRISLVLAPAQHHGAALKLSAWPDQMKTLMGSLSVNVIQGAVKTPVLKGVVVKHEIYPAAAEVWRVLFSRSGVFTPDELERLKLVMLPSEGRASRRGRPGSAGTHDVLVESKTTSYSAAGIEAVFGALRDAVAGTTLATRLMSPQGLPALADRANDETTSRALRAMAAEDKAPFSYAYAGRLLGVLSGSFACLKPEDQFFFHDEKGLAGRGLTIRQLTESMRQPRLATLAAAAGGRFSAAPEGMPSAMAQVDSAVVDAMKSGDYSKVRSLLEGLVADFLLDAEPAGAAGPGRRGLLSGASSAEQAVALVVALTIDQFEYAFGEARGTLRRRAATLPERASQSAALAQNNPDSQQLAAQARDNQARLQKAASDDALHEVQAKYSAVRSYPALGKALGFIVDIEIDPVHAGLGSDKEQVGFLQIGFGGTDDAVAARTAFLYNGTSGVFRPAAAHEAREATVAMGMAFALGEAQAAALPLKNGMVDLSEKRFSLSVVDVHASVNGNKVQFNEYGEARKNSSDDSAASLRIVGERGRGIQLLDEHAVKAAVRIVRQLNAAPATAAKAAEDAAKPLYAEDLVLGYRVFVQRYDTIKGRARKWASLMARTVQIRPRAGSGAELAPDAQFPEREHAYIRVLPRVERIAGDAGDPDPETAKARAVAPAHVFSWLGDSLGLPPPDPARPLTPEEAEAERRHVGMSITIKEARAADYRIPVLRCGSKYQFALAPVYAHGGGPTLAEVAALYGDAVLTPAEASAKAHLPFRYGPPDDIEAPRLLLPDDDPLLTRPAQAHNENLERLVLRSGGGQDRDRGSRFFAPPRISFDRAEQFGMFDDRRSDPRRGAFEGLRLERESGDFEVVKMGKNSVPVHEKVAGGPRVVHPYFPDPLARNLSFGLERKGAVPSACPPESPGRSFWRSSPGADAALALKAQPIELEVRRSHLERGAGFVDDIGQKKRGVSSQDTTRKLTLELAPAEELTVWAWCWPDMAMLCRARPGLPKLIESVYKRNHKLLGKIRGNERIPSAELEKQVGVRAQLEGIADSTEPVELVEKALATRAIAGNPELAKGEPKAVAQAVAELATQLKLRRELLEKSLFRRHPFNGINGWRKLTVVHAVVAPLKVPRNAQLQAARLLSGTVFAQWPAAGSALWTGQDEVGGTSIYLGGTLEFHRASTRAIRIEGNWPLLDYALAVSPETRDGVTRYVDRPPRHDQMLVDIIDIPRDVGPGPQGEHRNSATQLDLFRNEQGALRELLVRAASTGAASTAARIMDIRIVATSRFADDFTPDEPDRDPSTRSKFEVDTRPALRRKEASVPREHAIKVVLPATARPPAPVVTHIDWIMPEQSWRSCGGRSITSKSWVPRLYLDNSWRTSGEHELLAVIFERQSLFKPAGLDLDAARTPLREAGHVELSGMENNCTDAVEQLSATLSKMAEMELQAMLKCPPQAGEESGYTTRWGADPAGQPGSTPEMNMSPRRFSGYFASLAQARLPLQGTAPDAPVEEGRFAEVDILLYQPQLDAATGRWYVDIGIDPGLVHAPFVRLSLARYQPLGLQREAVKGQADGRGAAQPAIDLRMSPALLLDPMRVASPRFVEISCELKPDRQVVTATVYGAGYVKREPFGATPDVERYIEHPLQNFQLMRLSKRHPRALLCAFDESGRAHRQSQILPKKSGKLLAWECSFTLRDMAKSDVFALVINEMDMHVSDEVIERRRLQSTPPKMTAADLVERPAFFSLTVPLAGQIPQSPSPE